MHKSDIRSPKQAMLRGVLGRCPSCGEGRLFQKFMLSVGSCSACGEKINGHRADDFPAYLVIFIVGHVIVGLFMYCESLFLFPLWKTLAFWGFMCVFMSLALLQPVKGSIIGLQWALRMHGFRKQEEQ